MPFISYLNSKLNHYIIKRDFAELQGGTRELRKVFFVNLPIPKIPLSKQKVFEELVDLIIFAKENGLENEADKFESVIDGLVYDLYFEEEMKKANCYITDRITEVIEPFEAHQTDEPKTEYIKNFYNFCNKDEIIFHLYCIAEP
ncbi:hypothetical protein [Candidatus Marithrix sp. Canyon 246]|uniref:hypothetical protein n=1 Tax=Candidatus Marithrix sp. Canyon 246 TaxID=1827136 RepID=UPI00084A0F24|nr:hypothetical protein [Candidatus Marithrix sp. Canyon 246]